MSTILISHSSADNSLAMELLDWLNAEGYQSVFLDMDSDQGIKVGDQWEKVIYRELVSCSVVIALVTENWRGSQWCFAEVTHARASGKTLLGLMACHGIAPSILADTQLIDYRPENRAGAYFRLAKALERAIDPQGLGRWDSTRPLYPGLLSFDETDAPIFFGRRRLGGTIYQKLKEIQAKPPGSERLLLVFGHSGSGKSSLLRAGTLPHLRANKDAWIILGPFRPTEGWPEPLRQSIDILTDSDNEAMVGTLREMAKKLRSEAQLPKATILLLIDQLEEGLGTRDGVESKFLQPLSRLLELDNTPFLAVATLRSDFMGDFQKDCARHGVRFYPCPITSMEPGDLREVITGPCRMAGLDIEPGLVDALVGDAGNEEALPLLALTLNRLWWRHKDKKGGFSLDDYRIGLGGMRGLIHREAENTLYGLVAKGFKVSSVLDAFLCLTRLAREGLLTRQLTAWDSLEPEDQTCLEPFISARLLVRYSLDSDKSAEREAKGTVVVDLIHETLLNGWERLDRLWKVNAENAENRENRDFLLWRETLRPSVNRWLKAEKRQTPSLDGTELREAKKWLRGKPLALTKSEADYIQRAINANKSWKIKLAIATVLLLIAVVTWWDRKKNNIDDRINVLYGEGILPFKFGSPPDTINKQFKNHFSSLDNMPVATEYKQIKARYFWKPLREFSGMPIDLPYPEMYKGCNSDDNFLGFIFDDNGLFTISLRLHGEDCPVMRSLVDRIASAYDFSLIKVSENQMKFSYKGGKVDMYSAFNPQNQIGQIDWVRAGSEPPPYSK